MAGHFLFIYNTDIIKNEENLDGGKNFLIDLLNFLQKIRVNY